MDTQQINNDTSRIALRESGFICDHGLKECLEAFSGAGDGDSTAKMERLNGAFLLLARKILYGGYLKVRDDYEIYVRMVEFYYHEESGENRIEDPIVYHRNGKFPDRTLTPFPMMSLHAHWSGYDITFEDRDGRYRASALIREFAVFDRHAGGEGAWVYWHTGAEYGDGRYETCAGPKFDSRSTYLQFYLNGFSIDGSANRIIWMDFPSAEYGEPAGRPRRNVYQLEQGKRVPCTRPWAFRREDRLDCLRKG